ncbi:hypothetical protein HDU81_001089, partial [Chytriomyces hyalinus]
LNADVLAMVCAYLPPTVCGFCRKIHKSGKFECSRCHSDPALESLQDQRRKQVGLDTQLKR